MCVRLIFGLGVNKDVLAFLYLRLVSTFVVDEFTTVNSNNTTRIGEKRHRSQCENGVMLYRVVDHDFNMLSTASFDSWRSEFRNTVNASDLPLAV